MGQNLPATAQNDEAVENIVIRPYMFDFNVVLLDLENSNIAAVTFEGTKTNTIFEKYFKFDGSRTPPEMYILL
jgi:hypothetical protein